MLEIWKDVAGYEGKYRISNLGNVYSINSEMTLKSSLSIKGYPKVNLSKNGKYKTKVIHRLVAIEFIKNNEKYRQVNHINGIKTDNRSENLEWCDQSYNMKHAYINKLKLPNSGSKNGRAKIVESDVILIRAMLKNNIKSVYIAKKLQVSVSIISNIKNRKTWNHVKEKSCLEY